MGRIMTNRENAGALGHEDTDQDAIDMRTGNALFTDGTVPPREDNLTTPSFRSLSDEELWTQLTRFTPVAIVALKSSDVARGVFRGRLTDDGNGLSDAIQRVVNVRGVSAIDSDEDLSMPTMLDGASYPALHVEVGSMEALRELRALPIVDYVEPLYFFDGIGCSLPEYFASSADESFSPNPGQQPTDRVSWNFRHMGIQDAWKLFNNGFGVIVAPGRGVPIGVIDTGLYPDAPRFDDATFTLPPGTRNPPQRLSSRLDSTVRCSHGTRIAGLATAPAAGVPAPGTNYIGVAWGSDLISVKVGNGVVQTDTTVHGVVAGLDMAIAAGARVLTLAFGMPYASDYLRDNIVRIFDANPRVLLIAAAGTNVPWVTFPANMDREILAVTIVEFRPSGNTRYRKYQGPNYFPDIVAYGPSVDLAAVNGPDDIATQGNNQQPLTTIGGSSSATAMVAGIAALAWSRIPSLTRSELIARLANSASLAGIEGQEGLIGPGSEVGYGIPDAYVAAGGARRASITGPHVVMPGNSYTLMATTNGYEPFFRYQWNSGETLERSPHWQEFRTPLELIV
jgi:hypothetical protein